MITYIPLAKQIKSKYVFHAVSFLHLFLSSSDFVNEKKIARKEWKKQNGVCNDNLLRIDAPCFAAKRNDYNFEFYRRSSIFR